MDNLMDLFDSIQEWKDSLPLRNKRAAAMDRAQEQLLSCMDKVYEQRFKISSV
jgi:hypothetical protein